MAKANGGKAKSMTKSQIYDAVAQESEFSRADVKKFFAALESVVTDQLGSAGGLVVDRRGTPLGGFDVVLFPQDEARWYFASPFIRQTRSSQNGRFELPQLPPGDYLAVATEGVPFLMLGDPAPTLRRLQPIATRLTVRDGEQKTISIRASPAP